MAVNKVVYDGQTIIDISGSTVTPETLGEGIIAFNAKGEKIVGTAIIPNTTAVLGTAKLSVMVLGKE